MKRYEHKSQNAYVRAQRRVTRLKLAKQDRRGTGFDWLGETSAKCIARYLEDNLSPLERGICHGTRRGLEQSWFAKLTGADVIGTDISPLCEEFPNTVLWDFHDVKPEWVGAFDFVYSNALDHSNDPERAARAWMQSLRPGGVCLVHWSKWSAKERRITAADCFQGTVDDYLDVFSPHLLASQFPDGETRRKGTVLVFQQGTRNE